ncbi:choice-of-anchor E domain-containing protein [Blastopirellula retiformator]|uniref:Uncharacterized protein n=1 Tax=Blastopirellula retiformator TaxID=2527970 RepID=A0A5C5V210_9BACT|nr:choice-of-anchor E domain-containing protein [Blastopirellula retiformator]TWT31735.1 hypothetical protein Enr8_36590 [Blastopirellula retiformator]
MRIWYLLVLAFLPVTLQSGVALGDVITFASGPQSVSTNATLTGSSRNFTVNAPRFDPSWGTLQSIHITNDTSISIEAVSQATGGTFIPPIFIDNWVWQVQHAYTFAGPGISMSDSGPISTFGSISDPGPNHQANVNEEVFSTNVDLTLLPSDSLFSPFIGTGTIDIFAYSMAHTTEFPPLPATPAGFTWSLSSITGAAIAETATFDVSISYEFVPPPAVVPEPPTLVLSMIACALLGMIPLSKRIRQMLEGSAVSDIDA